MDKLKLLFGLLVGFTVIACSSKDDSSNENEETIRLFKKSESYSNGDLTGDITLNYNSENKIQSRISSDSNGNTIESINVNYSGNSITSITKIKDYPNPENVTYNVTIEDNKISLIDEDELYAVEIYHKNGYVDSINQLQLVTSGVFNEQTFKRDSNQNLVLSTRLDGGISFLYSNFDSNKMTDPLSNRLLLDTVYDDIIKIFDLKLTNSNPMSASVYYSDENDTDPLYNNYLEYDNLGYVIKQTFDQPNNTSYIEYQYIEL